MSKDVVLRHDWSQKEGKKEFLVRQGRPSIHTHTRKHARPRVKKEKNKKSGNSSNLFTIHLRCGTVYFSYLIRFEIVVSLVRKLRSFPNVYKNKKKNKKNINDVSLTPAKYTRPHWKYRLFFSFTVQSNKKKHSASRTNTGRRKYHANGNHS